MGKDENWDDILSRLVDQGNDNINNVSSNNSPSFGIQDEQKELLKFGIVNIEKELNPTFKQRIEFCEKDSKKK